MFSNETNHFLLESLLTIFQLLLLNWSHCSWKRQVFMRRRIAVVGLGFLCCRRLIDFREKYI
jgi:hypothetical protein